MMTSGVSPAAMASSRSASMPLRSPSMMRCSSRCSTGQPDRSSLAVHRGGGDPLEQRQQLGQRVVAVAAAVVDEVEADLPGPLVDLGQRQDLGGVDDGGVEAGLHALVEEDRVEDLAGRRVEAERHVGEPEDGVDAGQLGLDPPDALDGLDAVPPALLHARSTAAGPAGRTAGPRGAARSARRRCRGWPWPPAPSSRPCGPGPRCRCRCRRRRRRTPWPGSGTSRGGCRLGVALLQVDRVDDGPAADPRQGGLDDRGLGRVDHQRARWTGWRTARRPPPCRPPRRRRCSRRRRR